jgi:hypothetical protein
MQKNEMQFAVQKAKIYKDNYRPSSNILRLVKSLLAVILVGQSPVSTPSYNYVRKSK